MNILWLNVVGPRTGKFITSESTNKHFIYIACHSRKMHSNINPNFKPSFTQSLASNFPIPLLLLLFEIYIQR